MAGEELKRPDPPEAVENPLPALAEGMKALGSMQVAVTKVVEELEKYRQANYIAACKAYDEAKDGGKAKEEADKKTALDLFHAREVKRLKRKLAAQPAKADPDYHPMANPKIIARVLQHDDFDKANLQAFCLVGKAWVVPCRTLIFSKLSDLQVTTRARCDGLIELFTAKQSLAGVVRTVNFAFQPSDPAAPRHTALREALPSPIQFMLLLTLCTEAKALAFTNMAVYGATQTILNHTAPRIERITVDPKGYAWHGKSIEFGSGSQAAIFAAWPNLTELSLARVVLDIEDPNVYMNGQHHGDGPRSARCPLTNLALEKVRLRGRIWHMLEGAHNRLTHLSLVSVGSLQLRDLCQTLTEHGQSLTHLVLIGCQLAGADMRSGPFYNGGPDDDNEGWGPGGGRHGAFDRALSACVKLIHLSIEPGNLPIFQPGILFRALAKLETLEFNKKDANAYDASAWMSLLGLGPVLLEQKRKMKKIRFGHDWVSDPRPVVLLKTNWAKFAESVEFGRLAYTA